MNTIIIISIFVVILSYLSQFKKYRYLFSLSFIIIYIFTAFRYEVGTDYNNYYESFNYISRLSSFDCLDYSIFKVEPSWVILNYIFKPFGFFGFIITLSAFFCYTYYSLIKKYVEPRFYWVAVFIYLFSADIMWIQLSAIRQALSVAIFVHSVKYITEKKKPLNYVLFNLFGGLFHTSAFFMVPLVLFAFDKIKNNKITGLIIILVFGVLLLFGETFLSRITELTLLITGDAYANRLLSETDVSTTIIGSIAWISVLGIVIFYSYKQDERIKNLFYFSSLHSLVYVMSPLIWLSDRMGYYFAVFSIVVVPIILQNEKCKFKKIAVFSIFAIFLIYRLMNFLKLDWVIFGYSDYNTIFSY